ncbi:MAG: 50S ribosomal protein L25 [Parachlamydiales bacterium]
MELTIEKRDASRKRECKRLLREGRIPCVIYGKAGKSTPMSISTAEFGAALRGIKGGCLPTTRFSLKGEGDAVVKDIQYHRTTYDVIHLDFELIEEGQEIEVSVPIHCVGADQAPGIKTAGGVLRQVIRMLPVRALPGKIPSEVVIDVSGLEMKQTRRLRDIALPDGVKPRRKLDDVVVVIAKR